MPKEYDEQVAKLLQHIRISLPALGNATFSDEDYYASLPLCVIDAVFSIGVRYETREWLAIGARANSALDED